MARTRRELLRSARDAAAFAVASAAGEASTRPKRKVPYGAAVALGDLKAEPRLGRTIARDCSVVVPVGELKRSELRPAPGKFALDKADQIAASAADNGLAMRGHTLVWYAAMPDWTNEIASKAAAERAL